MLHQEFPSNFLTNVLRLFSFKSQSIATQVDARAPITLQKTEAIVVDILLTAEQGDIHFFATHRM